MITREFNLYLHAGHSIPLVINVNQYDQGEQWLFSLFNSDGTQYVPSSGAIVGIKSDNLGIINSGTVDSQGRVVINETQQMTAAVGKAVFELLIDDQSHGTANFVVLVEPKPGDNADLSETDISMIEQAIEAASSIKPYGSPLVASTVAGMTDHEKVYVYVGSETGYTSGNWYYWDGSAWTSGGVYNSVAVQTDTTLTLSGVAADAKKTGDEISDLKSEINLVAEKTVSDLVVEHDYSRSELTAGILSTNGTVVDSSTAGYTQPFEVAEGDIITAKKYYLNSQNQPVYADTPLRSVAVKKADQSYSNADGELNVNSYTVPSGIKYAQITISGVMSGTYDNVCIYQTTPDGQITYTLKDSIKSVIESEGVLELVNNELSTMNLANQYACALPNTTFRQTIGLAEKWYKKSIISPPSAHVFAQAGYSTTGYANDGFVFANEIAVSSANGYKYYAHDTLLNKIYDFDFGTGYGAPRRVIAENLSNCSLLAIGDSTVDSDVMTATLLSHFASKGRTITLLGTCGSATDPLNKNEGRAGWTTAEYMANTSKNGYTNPFYNNGFDFSYYMNQQGYSGVDFVVIQLGINDLYNVLDPNYASIFGNIKTMIDSILAYNANIKVIVNLPTTPNSDESAHSVAEYLYRNRVIKFNEYAQAQILSGFNENSVRCSYCHLILDPATDIRDNVHPTDAGYQKMALEVVNQINCFQNGTD